MTAIALTTVIAVAAVVAQGTEAQQTEQVILALIVLLLVVAALLTVLTIWYWRHTSPRRVERLVGRRAPEAHPGQPQHYRDSGPYQAPAGGYGAGHGYYEEPAATAVQPRVLGPQGGRR